jgi:RNA polymerase sigma-70 factor (ECF subfamily)
MEGKKKMQGAVEGMNGMERMLAAPILQSAQKPAPETLSHLNHLDSLIVRVRRGDIGAFDEIMNETQGRVLGLAYKLLGDKELAKDASQEAFLRAYKSLDTFKLGESFTAWIGRIAANVCFDQMKKREMGDSAPQLLESVPSSDSLEAEDAVLLNQRRALVQKALVALSPAERSALVLRDIEGMSTLEAAQALGLKEGTVRANISQARRKVKNFCQRLLRQNLLHYPKRDEGGRR